MASHSSILAWRIPWGPKELDTTERRTRSLSLFHAVERSNPERPHVPSSQFPYMVTSSKSQPACWFSQDTDCFITPGISRGHTHFPLSTPGNLSSVFQLHNLSFQDYYTSEKKKKITSIRGSHSTPGYILRETKTLILEDWCTPTFIAAFFFFFTIAKVWKQPKCPPRDE